MKCTRPKYCAGDFRHAITIERRELSHASALNAEPEHTYKTVLTTRAKIETKGARIWQGVVVEDAPTHVFTMRATTIPFDARDRVRDVKGNLYVIQSIEDVNEYGELTKLNCIERGSEAQEANQ